MHPVPNPLRPGRAICATCLRPARTCICHAVVRIESAVELLILQHPLEVANAKGSARLLHLCLPGSQMLTGEQFDTAELADLLTAGDRTPVLLYPETPTDSALIPAAALPSGTLADPARLRLVILDGTWRKSRKMLYLNPLLQELPRLALQDAPPSHYRIRKAHAPHQLSTLEAAAYALMQLDGAPARFEPLIAAFDDFVAQQSSYVRGA